ncbi:site-specific DNA-methyltransferase [Micromonospora sp. NPDC053740]|uniref:DNA-methyltransferase n=1 Tax=Micromonospora sp. NPDC053740 TaxID=3155173 RepID=UPI003431A53D
MTGYSTVLRADARAIPMPDASVDLIVTSPPYFALRSYTDGGEHYDGQIGAEPTPREYIAALIECTREWARVLKPSGSIFVNLGDKYAGQGSGRLSADGSPGLSSDQKSCDSSLSAQLPQCPSHPSPNGENGSPQSRQGTSVLGIDASTFRQGARDGNRRSRPSAVEGIPGKSLMLLPERYRIAAIDQLGLIARAVIIWSKSNGMPEAVTDRVRRSHEDWVHLTKQPRYFAAVDEIREPPSGYVRPNPAERRTPGGQRARAMADTCNPLGRLPGSVWEIATEPLQVPAELGVDHFAAFPTEWPRRIIQGWSPSGFCTACGEGRRPITDRGEYAAAHGKGPERRIPGEGRHPLSRHGEPGSTLRLSRAASIVGEVCACSDSSAPTRPAVVLDPFSGTGTTALVASALGRHGIGVDMSADYCRLARWRTTDPGQRAKAARLPAPPKQVNGQGDLFPGLGVAS